MSPFFVAKFLNLFNISPATGRGSDGRKVQDSMKNTKANRLAIREAILKQHKHSGWSIDRLENCIVCKTEGARANGKYFFDLKIFKGTAARPTCYYTFSTSQRRDEYAQGVIEGINKWVENRKPKKAAKAEDHFYVGDVLYSSWGYDQTNVEFYQVVGVKGSYVSFIEVCQNSSDFHGSPCGGLTQPRRNEFVEDAPVIKKLVQGDGTVKAPISGTLSKWEGKAIRTSSYA